MLPQYKPVYSEREAKALYDLVMSGSYLADFKKTEEFENKLSNLTGNKYCVAVNNGTIAISLALLACGVRPNDCVIVPNLTMIATATSVSFIGAQPIFVDIEPDTLCLDVTKTIARIKDGLALGESIKAVVYVTLNGRMNLEILKLKKFCEENNITLIKDDAQSLMSYTKEKKCVQDSSYGHMHTLSFSPHKIISCGQGGAILTNDDKFGESLNRLKDFGRLSGGADIHDYFGINSKFTEMQAVVGLTQLEDLLHRIIFKQKLYRSYYERLKDLMIEPKDETPWFIDVFLSTKRLRNGLIDFLSSHSIGARAIYPALTTQKIYNRYDEEDDYRVSKYLGDTGLWLPSSFDVTEEQVENVCNLIKGYLF